MGEFSIGDLIEVFCNNKYGMGIKISYKTTIGVNNKLIISIGKEIIEYNIGIIQKHTQYALIKDDKKIILYIDGYNVKGNINPTIDYDLEINNKPVLFNRDGLLKGSIDFLIIYSKKKSLPDIISIKNFLTTGLPIEAQTVSQMVDRVLAMPEGTRLLLLAPVARGKSYHAHRQHEPPAKAGSARGRWAAAVGRSTGRAEWAGQWRSTWYSAGNPRCLWVPPRRESRPLIFARLPGCPARVRWDCRCPLATRCSSGWRRTPAPACGTWSRRSS